MFATPTETAVLELFSKHLISAAWFYAGQQYLTKGNLLGAFLWQVIAVLLLVAFCINIFLSVNKSWLSPAIAVAAIGAEIWHIHCKVENEVRKAMCGIKAAV